MSADLRQIAHDSLSLTEAPFLKHYRRGRFRTWKGVAMTGSELPGPGFNFAACLGPTPTLDEILPTARDFFSESDKGWGILVEGNAGHPIEAEVKERGWKVEEDEPAFVLPDISVATRAAAPLNGLAVRPILNEADWATFQHVTTAAFNAPPDLADLIMPSMGHALDPQMGWYIGEWEGEPVAAGGYLRSGTTAVICCLATLDSHRGRGIGAAVTRFVLSRAEEKGCTRASLRSGPLSVPLYERLGFRYVCQHRTYAAPV